MTSVLSIYKIRLPFFEYKYEGAVFEEICWDLEKLLKYREIYQELIEQKQEKYIKKTLLFIWGRCELLLYTSGSYYIPKYQVELFFESSIDHELIRKIVAIFTSFNLRNYIFDYSSEVERYLDDKNILTSKVLEKDFSCFWVDKLEDFLKNTQTKYLSETLKNQPQIRNSFYYMIHICYLYKQNCLNAEKELWDINTLKQSSTDVEHQWILELSWQRLEHIHNINLVNFKKYKKVLDLFFNILKST